jgi:hypothetical protein
MTYDLLPPEEPGDELTEAYPGFTDRLMQRIDDYERRQRRYRAGATVVPIVIFLVVGSYMLNTKRVDNELAIAKKQPRPVATPAVQAAPVQHAASPRSVPKAAAPVQQAASSRSVPKPATPVTPPAAHEQSAAALPKEGSNPEEVKITLDGKELHGITLKDLSKCAPPGVKLVRDTKPVNNTVPVSTTANGSPCRSH